VHEARKKIKRVRALLRLLREPLGPIFARENGAMRDTAHGLTAAREAAAALEALTRLQEEHPDPATPARFDAARAELAPHAPVHREGVAELLLRAAEGLRLARQRLSEVELEDSGWELVGQGFEDGYRRARRALQQAFLHLTPEAFHELRKAVKSHQHQLQLFEPAWSDLLEPRRRALAELSELLGHHHDLALLAPNLRQRGFADVAAAAEERSAEVEQEILREARKLLAERPRHFSGSLGAWFENYQHQVSGTAPARPH
jgi:CHAD domain-containing protein